MYTKTIIPSYLRQSPKHTIGFSQSSSDIIITAAVILYDAAKVAEFMYILYCIARHCYVTILQGTYNHSVNATL